MPKVRSLIVLTLLIAVLALSGCGKSSAPAELQGTWTVESFGGIKGLVASDMAVRTTLTLRDGKVSGNGGVNSFGGTYQATADSLSFSDISATMMAGSLGAMTQEKKFMDALPKTKRYVIEGGKLILESSNNDTLVVLIRQ